MSLLVKEIYPALVGESGLSGWPALLIRLSQCNLRCGYCDTRYAWKGGRKRSVEDLVRISTRKGFRKILLTGGEPLLQDDSLRLISELIRSGRQVLLETNGSLPIEAVPKEAHIIMDLKTPGSGEDSANRYQNLECLKPSDELKFVLTGLNDYHWAREIMREFELDRRCTVNFSPAAGLLDPAKLARGLIRDKIPARLNLQLHRILFPKKERGV